LSLPINIAIIAGQLVVGGAERQLYLWLANLDRAKFNPIVVTLHPGHYDYWEKPIEELGIPLFRIPQSGNRLARLWQIIRILHPFKPHLIHGWHMFSGAYAALAAKLLGAKSIAGIRSSFKAIEGSPETFLVRHLCDALIANSQTAASQYHIELKPKHQKIFMVRNAVIPEFEQCQVARQLLTDRFSLPSEVPWLASIGRMEPLKRFDLLIRACALLQQQGSNFHLILVGDGLERSPLQKLALTLGLSQSITFTGEVPFASSWMPAFDIFCFPSMAEGAPNVVIEAAAAGCPLIAWDLPFNKEILPDEQMALLLPPGDTAAMADVLRELIQSQSLRQSLGSAAQEHVLHNFGLSKYVASMTEVYEEVLGSKV